MKPRAPNREAEGTAPLATGPRAIMLVGPLPPPFAGMANQTRQLAQLLAGEGLTVEVVQVNTPYRPAFVERIKGLRAVFRLVPYLARLYRAAGRADVMHVMANSGWAWHFFATPAVWVGWLRGVPVVVNYRGGEAELFFARQFRWVRPTIARAALVMVPSGFLEDVFGRRGIAAAIVPNIVDVTLFSPASALASQPHVVVTRNLEPIYDIETALRAFALVHSTMPLARMTVAGSGPGKDALERLALELNVADAVCFAGRIDNTELPALYRTATVALNPSLADNMPISLLEAMASGVPIVSTNVGGIPQLVDDGKTALLVPPKDPVAMAVAMRRVMTEAKLANALRQAGIETAGRFTWSDVRPRLLGAYAHALGMPRPNSGSDTKARPDVPARVIR